MPDPQDESTFDRCRLRWEQAGEGQHRVLRDFYRELIRLRKEVPALRRLSKDDLEVTVFTREKALLLRRWAGEEQALIALNLGDSRARITATVPPGVWEKRLDSASAEWGGPGDGAPETLQPAGEVDLALQPLSLAVFVRRSQE